MLHIILTQGKLNLLFKKHLEFLKLKMSDLKTRLSRGWTLALLLVLMLLVPFPSDAQEQGKEGLSYLEVANRFGYLATQIESRLSSGEVASYTLFGPLCVFK